MVKEADSKSAGFSRAGSNPAADVFSFFRIFYAMGSLFCVLFYTLFISVYSIYFIRIVFFCIILNSQ